MIKIMFYLVRLATFFSAIVLWKLTESAIRADLGDMLYIVNAIFLAFGGNAIGHKINSFINDRIKSEQNVE